MELILSRILLNPHGNSKLRTFTCTTVEKHHKVKRQTLVPLFCILSENYPKMKSSAAVITLHCMYSLALDPPVRYLHGIVQ